MDFILSFYERIAEAIHKTKVPLIWPGLVLCFIGLFLMETGTKPLGFWFVIFGILLSGTGIFSLMFAPTEQTLLHGEYVLRSKVRNSALIPTIFFLTFFTYWYAFMVYAIFNITKKHLALRLGRACESQRGLVEVPQLNA